MNTQEIMNYAYNANAIQLCPLFDEQVANTLNIIR
jgi:hypothetical protein